MTLRLVATLSLLSALHPAPAAPPVTPPSSYDAAIRALVEEMRGQPADPPETPATQAATPPVTAEPPNPTESVPAERWEAGPVAAQADGFWPALNEANRAWLAVLLVLALLAPGARGQWWRLADALVLAAIVLCWLGRTAAPAAPAGATDWRLVAYSGLAFGLLYFAVRGLLVFLDFLPARPPTAGSPVGLVVFAALGGVFLAVAARSAPLADSVVDGIVGGVRLADEGRLPYGEPTVHAGRSPLLYASFAALIESGLLMPLPVGDHSAVADRIIVAAHQDIAYPARVLRGFHAILLALIALGLIVIGARLATPTIGAALAVVLAVMPMTHAAAGDPAQLIPATLLVWSAALLTFPAFGALLGMFLLTLAGLSWPWIWLIVPLGLLYTVKRGWSAVGGVLGFLLALALIGFALPKWVRPAVPRPDGILAVVGGGAHELLVAENGSVYRVEPRSAASASSHWLAAPTRWLLSQDILTLQRAAERPSTPALQVAEGAAAGAIRYVDVRIEDESARAALQNDYRIDLQGADERTRFFAAVRTAVEATWKPVARPLPDVDAGWRVLTQRARFNPERVDLLRRGLKLFAGALALVLTVVLLLRRNVQLGRVLGGMVLVLTVGQLASAASFGGFWFILLPLWLAAYAACGERRSGEYAPVVPASAPPPIRRDLGPPPGSGVWRSERP